MRKLSTCSIRPVQKKSEQATENEDSPNNSEDRKGGGREDGEWMESEEGQM